VENFGCDFVGDCDASMFLNVCILSLIGTTSSSCSSFVMGVGALFTGVGVPDGIGGTTAEGGGVAFGAWPLGVVGALRARAGTDELLAGCGAFLCGVVASFVCVRQGLDGLCTVAFCGFVSFCCALQGLDGRC